MPQLELLPTDPALGKPWTPNRRIPPAVRKFGKFIDTSMLDPGDLVLTRDIAPDNVSKLITKTQYDLGYGEDDARWTHAAVYVGDGFRLIEATFDSVLRGGKVKLSFIYDYCGQHALRCRRPKEVARDPIGWTLVLEAATLLGEKYDFAAALKLFWEGWKSVGKWDANTQAYVSPGIVCSTLYADCFAKVTRKCLGDSGTCVPAYLSCCEDFEDLSVNWRQMK